MILERISRVEGRKVGGRESIATKERIRVIVESFRQYYVEQPINYTTEKSVMAYKAGKKMAYTNGLPMYIHLKAFVIVSQ